MSKTAEYVDQATAYDIAHDIMHALDNHRTEEGAYFDIESPEHDGDGDGATMRVELTDGDGLSVPVNITVTLA